MAVKYDRGRFSDYAHGHQRFAETGGRFLEPPRRENAPQVRGFIILSLILLTALALLVPKFLKPAPTQGFTVDGIVTGKTVREDPAGDKYLINLEINIPDREAIRGAVPVSLAFWERLSEQDTVTVECEVRPDNEQLFIVSVGPPPPVEADSETAADVAPSSGDAID